MIAYMKQWLWVDFTRQIIRWTVFHRWNLKHVNQQIFNVGVRSFTTTIWAGAFVGAIMAIQIHDQLKDFGAQAFLGGLSTSVTIRNVGPVLIAFVLSGKVGAYTSAELATMRVTDQIDALRCIGVNPLRYLVAPRFLAVVISSFLLLIVGLMVTILGGLLISTLSLSINQQQFLSEIPDMVSGLSILTGLVKSFVFGSLISIICCYHGYFAKGGAAGVGETVRRSSVYTLVFIVFADYLLSIVFELVERALI